MRKKINLLLSFLWLATVYGMYFFMRSQLEFPAIRLDSLGIFLICIMIPPFWAMFFSLVLKNKRKILHTIISVFIVLGIFVHAGYVFVCTGGFQFWSPGGYPLYSETTNEKDYLVLDGKLKDNYDNIIKYMPEDIPQSATDVTYEYKYDSSVSGRFTASWSLPEDELKALEEEFKTKDCSIEQIEKGTVYTIKWNVTDVPAFFTTMNVYFWYETNTVSYWVSQIYCD